MDVVDGSTDRRRKMTGDETLAEMGLGSAILETDPDQRHGADQTQPTPTYEEARAADAQLKQAWEAVGTARRALVDATTRAVAALEAFDRLDGKRSAYLDSDLATEPDASQVSEPDPQASSSEGTSRQEPTVRDTGTGPDTLVARPRVDTSFLDGIDFSGIDPVDEEYTAMIQHNGQWYSLDDKDNIYNSDGQQVDDDFEVIPDNSDGTETPSRSEVAGEVATAGEVALGPPPSTTTGLDPVIQRLLDNEKARLEKGGAVRSIDEAEREFGLGDDSEVDDGEPVRRARATRAPAQGPARQSAPQWTSIQDISAGIDATADPKRVVLLAVSSADEARTVLRNGLDPQTFGDDFRKGLQVEGVTSADVKGLLRKRAERIPEKDRKKAFVILGRAEYQDHIEPENIIGVAPMSTFRPSVVSLFEEETVTGTETA